MYCFEFIDSKEQALDAVNELTISEDRRQAMIANIEQGNYLSAHAELRSISTVDFSLAGWLIRQQIAQVEAM